IGRLNWPAKWPFKSGRRPAGQSWPPPNTNLKGYVHNICLDPYGFLLMSEIQIKIWKKVSLNNPIWYFDATGSVHKDIYRQNKPLLYSIVVHDRENKQILPVAEFITTDQSVKSISSYLHNIDYNLRD
ncbi:kDa in NOF-FB transposable element, partial [Brachionus plicatilis]